MKKKIATDSGKQLLKKLFDIVPVLLKKESGKTCYEFEILRNKKPGIFTAPGSDISLYCYSKNVPNDEALPLRKAILL
ncbi:hypothetical protein QE422_000645 [Chryseobacterium sp. SORGH_AS 447]|uniref:hypothetical protein n=1 Tax=Chryseobacterium sp. SORGH_AS_0447 TaxID=3041769 RepID=UPI00278ACC5F|nr:hypothetical protein [Chryseobacterium sp. SORGH_AS_0447]MDQ1160277.1 hypothetical protein [Chryseobacterium sp. SORGH_AS_0447]